MYRTATPSRNVSTLDLVSFANGMMAGPRPIHRSPAADPAFIAECNAVHDARESANPVTDSELDAMWLARLARAEAEEDLGHMAGGGF